MSNLGVGKIRGLQQISTIDGVFVICALDHRGSLKAMIEREQAEKADYQELVEHKLALCSVLAPYASAVLLDPNYGAAQCITAGVLPGDTGLLISVESTGYQTDPRGRITTLLDGWSVEKIKRMGGSAAKILVYYRPDIPEIAGKQLETLRIVAEECLKYDLPFLIEPVAYPVDGEKAGSAEFAAKKPGLVIKTARQITELQLNVLKAEFPSDMNYEKDEGKLLESCRKLDQTTSVPWVVLSAGVDFDTFLKQVKIACQAGASGFLGGRAIWQEAVHFTDKKERANFLKTTVADRMKELAEVATRYATPWYRKLGISSNELTAISEGWYINY